MLKMSLKFCAIIFIATGFYSCGSIHPALSDLADLEGSWTGSAGDARIYENWRIEGDYLLGEACVVEGNDTLVNESMKIEVVAGKPVFIARIEDGDPVLFSLISRERNTWIFENREHDFPQRIAYTLQGEDQLFAYVEGKHQGEMMKEEFIYTRDK